VALPPLHLIVGDGNWQTVRAWWRTLHGDDTPCREDRTPILRKAFELECAPSPLIVTGDQAKTTLSLRSAGTYKINGRLSLIPGAELKNAQNPIQVKSLTNDKPVVHTLVLRRNRQAAAGPVPLDLRFETDEAVYRQRTTALLLPRRAQPVRIGPGADDQLINLSNGLLDLQIAPSFMGSITSLRVQGKEFLNSYYPQTGVRDWRNPWHGDLVPQYDRLWGRLHKERFRHRQIQRKGAQGLAWQGVRVYSTISDQEERGHTISLDYLLAPGVDVLAVVLGI
jgi:hypothetical protein